MSRTAPEPRSADNLLPKTRCSSKEYFAGNVLTLVSNGMIGINRATFEFQQDGTSRCMLEVSKEG
ncbi:MAG TPA: hypothetical protein VL633_03510 [Bacteroidota bacterium]|nr:hypothetical protein [Bacteroidota bacterium]